MVADDVIANVIQFLEAEQRRGRKRVFLAPETARALLAEETRQPPVASPSTVTPAATVHAAAAPRPIAPAPAPLARPRISAPPTASPAPAEEWVPPAEGGGPLNLSSETLESLPTLVAACRRCRLCQQRRQSVFADGDSHARLMFVGEGPGEDEDIQGKPFVGRAGQLLTKMIEAMHLRREDTYIANIVKCRPPGNRVPQEDEARTCLPFLVRQIELVKPAVIVVLGATPFLYLLGRKGLSQLRGTWHEYRGVPVMPTFHPAYLLRVPERKREVWLDLQQVMKRLGLAR